MGKILLRRNSTANATPTSAQIEPGELAINTVDGRLFTELSNGTVVNLPVKSIEGQAITPSSVQTSGAADGIRLLSGGNSNSRYVTLAPNDLYGNRTIYLPDSNCDLAATYNGSPAAAGITANQKVGTLRGNLGDPSAEEMALFHGQFTNKFRFIPPTLQEESSDGTTWTTSTRATADQLKDMMIGEGQGTTITAIPSAAVGTYGGYRLTWDVVGQTGYVFLNMLYIYSCACGNQIATKVEKYNPLNDLWVDVHTGVISNYPGHTTIKHSTIAYHPSTTSATTYNKVRITFESTHNAYTNGFFLYGIEWWGGYPGGQRRNVESYDRNKNVTFPNQIRASGHFTAGQTTLCTNVNADLLDGRHGSGYISGDNNAWQNSADGAGRFYFATNSKSYYKSGGGHEFRHSNDTVIFNVDYQGNCTLPGLAGIGTTDPQDRLHLNGSQTVARIQSTNAYDTLVRFVDTQSDWTAGINQGNGLGNGFFSIKSMTANAHRLVIDTAGNIGIGTNAPAYSLDTGRAAAAKLAGKVFKSLSTTALYTANTDVYIGTLVTNTNGDAAAARIRLSAPGSEVWRDIDFMLRNSGGTNTGFNYTVTGSAGNSSLFFKYINRTGEANKTDIFISNGASGVSYTQFIQVESPSQGPAWSSDPDKLIDDTGYDVTGATAVNLDTAAAVVYNSSGNVGIGTTDPSAKFHLNNSGSTNPGFYANVGNSGDTTTLFEHEGANTPVAFALRKSGSLQSGGASMRPFGVLHLDHARADADIGANLHFTLRDSAGNVQEYGGIGAHIISPTSGAEQGNVTIYTTHGGATRNPRITARHDGNVGIGTTNPDNRLTVAGDVNVTSGNGFKINNTATAGNYLRGDGTRFVANTIQSGDLGSGTADSAAFLRGDRTWQTLNWDAIGSKPTTFAEFGLSGKYSQTNPYFGQQGIKHSFIDNVLYSAADRFDFYIDGVISSNNNLFNLVFDQYVNSISIPANTTKIFRLVFNTKSNGVNGITYAPGHVYLSFYGTAIPSSVSGRAKDRLDNWRNLVNWTNVSTNSNYAVWKGEIPNHNYMVELEVTVVAGGAEARITQLEYVMSRPGQFELGSINKAQNNTLWRNLNFKNSSNATTLNIAPSGNLTTTGSIGVGTTSTGSRLVVKGGGITSADSALNVTDSANSSLLFVRNDGKVSIGTTTPNVDQNAKLTINGDTYGNNFYGTFVGSLSGQASSAANVAWSGVSGKPSTFTPSSHTHGNLTNDGKIGTTANLPLITGTGGAVQAGSFGTQANTFCQGNDSRLSNARTPTAHTHVAGDVLWQGEADGYLENNISVNSALAAINSAVSSLEVAPPAHTHSAATTSVAGFMSATDKSKLDGIAAGAQVNVGTNIAQGTRTTVSVIISSSTGTGATLSAATTSLAGVMSSADKSKLDGIAANANNYSLPATVFRNDANNSGDLRFAAADGLGVQFWNSNSFKIWMSSSTNATWGGRLDSTSDYNMYFKFAGGGTNRGFVFQTNAGNAFQIEQSGSLRTAGTALTASGAFDIAATGNNQLTITTNSTERLRVSGAGDVGIGTASPAQKLHVDSDSYQVRLNNTGTGGCYWNIGASNSGFSSGGDSLIFVPNGTGSTSATVAFTTSGNAGFGTYTPQARVHAHDATALSASDTKIETAIVSAGTGSGIGARQGIQFRANGPSDAIRVCGVYQTVEYAYANSTGLAFHTSAWTGASTSDQERVRISSAGDVGIGVTSPGSRLVVKGSGITSAASALNVTDSTDASLLFVRNDGNVGVGTTSPGNKLEVNGSFAATTKSFRIQHPSKPDHVLEYGSLESPYHGVRLTGRGVVTESRGEVMLPAYLKDLVHDDETLTIQITNYRHGKLLYVSAIDLQNDAFFVACDLPSDTPLEFFWSLTAVRKDVAPLAVEQEA